MIKSAKEAAVIDLDLPASVEYLVIARLITSLVCKRMGFSEEKAEDTTIAVAEACINSIKHAYRNNQKYVKRVNIRYLLYQEESTQQKLAIVVKDFGKGFDPYFVQLYIERADVERPETVGLGIFLIKTLMDEVEYDSSPARGTQLRMIKYK